jgi:transcriptional regulator with XRE-family HTH domain
MALSLGAVIKQSRAIRGLSAVEAVRGADISPAYLSKLENDAVKRPSPNVLHRLSQALAVPYADLMSLSGYRVPGAPNPTATASIGAALFADISRERDERWSISPGIALAAVVAASPLEAPDYPASAMGTARETTLTRPQDYLVTLRNLVSSGQPAATGLARRPGVARPPPR